MWKATPATSVATQNGTPYMLIDTTPQPRLLHMAARTDTPATMTAPPVTTTAIQAAKAAISADLSPPPAAMTATSASSHATAPATMRAATATDCHTSYHHWHAHRHTANSDRSPASRISNDDHYASRHKHSQNNGHTWLDHCHDHSYSSDIDNDASSNPVHTAVAQATILAPHGRHIARQATMTATRSSHSHCGAAATAAIIMAIPS
jgi:hypothetical protein